MVSQLAGADDMPRPRVVISTSISEMTDRAEAALDQALES